VDYDTRECDTGAVGRKLWLGNPSEFEKVFFCDWTFAGATWTCRILLGFGRQREQREDNLYDRLKHSRLAQAHAYPRAWKVMNGERGCCYSALCVSFGATGSTPTELRRVIY